MRHESYDVIIVGGAVMGSSAAYHLIRAEPGLKVAVIERDPTYERASTSLCLGGFRVQFSLKENILMSLYAREFFSRFEEEMSVKGERPSIQMREHGYLFLIDSPGRETAEHGLDFQKKCGGEVEWWRPEKIEEEYPLLSAGAFAGGTFGPRDGYVDPYGLLMGFRKKALSLGVRYLAESAVKLEIRDKRITGVMLGSGEMVRAPVVVNAAGAWAAEIARSAGVEIPVTPVRRQVFVVKPEVRLEPPLPLVIAPSGLYFRSETGGLILVGKSTADDPEGFDFNWEWERFKEELWPELVGIVPSFQTLKLVRGWAGLYEVNRFDGNAILGAWPGTEGLYLMNGFSGHGLQQSPAAGRHLAELILHRAPALDLSCFGPRRILENKPLREGGLV
jgi:FAD-dependent oxidoreductase domain-containing protein 1